jgi:hypothetical protein
MPPACLFCSVDTECYKVVIDAEKFDKKSVYLTDARRIGIMLRDRRLTLRNHSALTCFVVEAVSDKDFILQATNVSEKGYVTVGDKGAFFAQGSREEAQKFQIEVTELGSELYLSGNRPAVFDDFHDVSIGSWKTDLSFIPILIHSNGLAKIWSVVGSNNNNGVANED